MATMKLVIVRHGQSEWNLKNLFTGWCDVNLSPKGVEEATNAGKALSAAGFDFDYCFTSFQKRAINTLNLILKSMDREWLPVEKSYKLNERHYGALQGLNKAETAAKYGDEQVKLWRRSFDVPPPPLDPASELNAQKWEQYRNVPQSEIPLCESLKDTIKRTVPFFNEAIKPRILKGERIIIAAHGNSLRSLIKEIEKISDEDIINVEIPTGKPLVYELDENFVPVKKYYVE